METLLLVLTVVSDGAEVRFIASEMEKMIEGIGLQLSLGFCIKQIMYNRHVSWPYNIIALQS